MRFACSLAIIAPILFGCGKEASKVPPPKLTVADNLDVCSPFDSPDGSKELFFESDKTVSLHEALGDERAAGALVAKHPKITKGTWSADEKNKRVVVKLGDAEKTYFMFTPWDESGCFLFQGTMQSANLENSWFGADSGPDEPTERGDP